MKLTTDYEREQQCAFRRRTQTQQAIQDLPEKVICFNFLIFWLFLIFFFNSLLYKLVSRTLSTQITRTDLIRTN